MSVAGVIGEVAAALAMPDLVRAVTSCTPTCSMIAVVLDGETVAVGVVMLVPGTASGGALYRWTVATPKGGPVDDGRDVAELAARDLAEVLLHCVRVSR